jgi:hypothetical protein
MAGGAHACDTQHSKLGEQFHYESLKLPWCETISHITRPTMVSHRSLARPTGNTPSSRMSPVQARRVVRHRAEVGGDAV